MSQKISADAGAGRVAGIQTLALLLLCAVAFRSELGASILMAAGNWEAAHLLVAPVLILILLWRRRRKLVRGVEGASIWGPVFVALALGLWIVSTWPLSFAYPRRLALLPAVAGIILTVGGWRVLRLCLPMLLILLIAIPLGSRNYAMLTAGPGRQTLAAACAALDALPGVLIDRTGLDVSYIRGSVSGTIAPGEPVRGASLMLSFLTMIVFVTFMRKRPLWHLAAMGILALPLMMLCSFVRLFVHGLVTLYGGTDALSSVPRISAAVVSIVFAYGATVLVLWTLEKIVIEERWPAEGDGEHIEPGAGAEAPRRSVRALWRAVFSSLFVASAILFLLAAVALRPGAEALVRHYRKAPIDLRTPLSEFDATKMRSFRLARDGMDLAPGEETSGDGIDARVSLLFEDRPGGAAPASARPEVLLTVTYASDPDRPVPHPPELVYRRHGAIVDEVTALGVETPDLAPNPWEVPARRIEIQQDGEHLILVYLYCCNGRFYNDRERMRFALGWPGDRYVYFSRIDALMNWPPGMSRREATERCQALLSEAVPILVTDHFPRREDVARR
ncbi:MAG: archaeosortase/exosortase family protein [Planctomycetota bacterium]|nr:archaeosortase/exosortase family protein [Planctomycetota bacterium]